MMVGKEAYDLTFGALGRTYCTNQIRQYLDRFADAGVLYELKEYRAWLSSDYSLIIRGPADLVRRITRDLDRWLIEIAKEEE